MEFTVFINLSETEASRLIELIILVIGALMAGILLIRPLVMRLARGQSESTPSPRDVEDQDEAGRPGMVKVSVWVPESNAGHVQMLARELRRGPRDGGNETSRSTPRSANSKQSGRSEQSQPSGT